MTTIDRRIDNAMSNIIEKKYEDALIQLSIAIDSTSKKKYNSKKVGDRIVSFLKEYEALMYKMSSNGAVHLGKNARIIFQEGKELPELIYTLVRCALLHGDEFEDKVVKKEVNNTFGTENGKFIINIGHINSLLLAVIIDPAIKMRPAL